MLSHFQPGRIKAEIHCHISVWTGYYIPITHMVNQQACFHVSDLHCIIVLKWSGGTQGGPASAGLKSWSQNKEAERRAGISKEEKEAGLDRELRTFVNLLGLSQFLHQARWWYHLNFTNPHIWSPKFAWRRRTPITQFMISSGARSGGRRGKVSLKKEELSVRHNLLYLCD